MLRPELLPGFEPEKKNAGVNLHSLSYFGQYPLEAYILGHKWAANAYIPAPKYEFPYMQDGRLFRAVHVAIKSIQSGTNAVDAIRESAIKCFAPMLDIAKILGNHRGRRDSLGLE